MTILHWQCWGATEPPLAKKRGRMQTGGPQHYFGLRVWVGPSEYAQIRPTFTRARTRAGQRQSGGTPSQSSAGTCPGQAEAALCLCPGDL